MLLRNIFRNIMYEKQTGGQFHSSSKKHFNPKKKIPEWSLDWKPIMMCGAGCTSQVQTSLDQANTQDLCAVHKQARRSSSP